MMSISSVISGVSVLLGVVCLAIIKKNEHHHMDNSFYDNKESKYDEELTILDSIIKRAKLKNEGKSIDYVLENLKKNDISLNFSITAEEKNERC